MTKKFAKESDKTKKLREKLLAKWEKHETLITDAALEVTIEKIHQWISTHSMGREVLKNKEIRLFDQNQNAARLSQKIQKIIQKISQDTVQ